MLTPSQLNDLPETLIEMVSQVELDIIEYIARRIRARKLWIPSTEWQYEKLRELGVTREWIINRLAKYASLAEREIVEIMRDAGSKALASDDRIYKAAGRNPSGITNSPALDDVLKEGIRRTKGVFKNLTATTANTATQQFEQALDRAYMQVNSGAYDANKAIEDAARSLASNGIAAIKYPSGHVDYIDVAVRRAVVTGVNQTALGLQETRADEMGCDLVEVSAHSGARPSHAAWQGRVYCRRGHHPEYKDFVSTTGYGSGDGLGGWNCRHSFYPFFEGLSICANTKEDLQAMEDKRVDYNGKSLTMYEAQQRQRFIERKIRASKREQTAMEAIGHSAEKAKADLAKWRRIQRDFISQTGLKRQYAREKTA